MTDTQLTQLYLQQVILSYKVDYLQFDSILIRLSICSLIFIFSYYLNVFRPASLVVGDFGCGDAKIARSVKQKVHSFDLYPMNKHVTVCDTKKVSSVRKKNK